MNQHRNVTSDLKRACSDAAIAALVLARLGRTEARPEIERLLEGAEGEERAALEEAAALLRDAR